MKKLILIAFAFVGLCSCFTACSGGKNGEDKDTIPTFVKADTMLVLQLTDNYLRLLQENKTDSAFDMLYELNGDTLWQISDERREMLRKQNKIFPVLKYHKTGMEFIDERHVSVTYAIEFFEKDPKDSIQNEIRIEFAPERHDAVWYLGLQKDR